MRVLMADPSAFTPPYDRALCAALARAGAEVELVTSRFAYADVPPAAGYAVREGFYRWAPGPPGSARRRAAKLVQHVPDMLRLRRRAERGAADVVHFQWLAAQPLDVVLLPRGRPLVLTAHDVLPREPRPGARAAQRRLYARADAVIVHSEHGRRRLTGALGLAPERVHVVPHGAFDHLAALAPAPLPAELAGAPAPGALVVLCFGLLRPYKGLDVLLDAWRRLAGAGVPSAELWIVGRPRMDVGALRRHAPPGVRWITRFVSDAELAAVFRRADLAVLPYREIDQSGVLFTALAFATPLLVSAVGGFPELAAAGAAELVPPGDAAALAAALEALLADPERRAALSAAARRAARDTYSWDLAARRTLALYAALSA